MKTYPLLQSQLGVLLQSMQHPESTHYNLPNYLFIPLSMTRERVVRAAQKLIESFPELHTRFVANEQGEVRQWSDMSMPIPIVSRQCTEAELQVYISERFVRPFHPLGSDPLFRVEVIETEKTIYLLFDAHHAIMDGMSFLSVVSNALVTIFEGGSVEPPTYGLYQAAEDEVAAFGTEVYQRAKAYYAEKFAGQEMATLSHAKPGTMGQMGRCIATLDRYKCDDWCHEHGVQPNLLFQAAFGHVMSVLTRQEKVAYSSVNHGRMDKRLRGSVGMFVKSVPMLVNADPSQRVIDFVKSQRTELMSTIRYGAYPFTHFCSDLGMKPGVTFNYMAMANMEEYMVVDGVKICAVQPVRKETDSDLSVDIYLKDENYEIRVESSLAMNDADTLQMVAEAIRVAVCNMMAHPELTLEELDIVSADERFALVELGTGKHLDIDLQMTFVKAFEQCASQYPDRLAVADDTESLTYGELSRRSNVLAQQLIASGVKPNDFVAVKLDRTIDFPIAVIAIHKAGAAYVPIDLEYPEDRQQYMLNDCQAKVVIDKQFIAETDFSQDVASVDLSTADGLAYMIYTSGSTGRPKGVMIGQRGLSSYIASMTDVLGLTASDRISLHRPFSFDAHIQDLYPALTVGGSLHIMPSEIRRDIQGMCDFIASHGITGGSYTTSLGKLLIESGPLQLRYMTLTGERMADLVSGDVQLFNGYGPTECTDLISAYRLERGRSYTNIPIGRPMANSHCFIVDAHGRLLPRGAAGELCFASAQVSTGYWQQPELTAEKFCDCPFLPTDGDGRPVRMYRTGDLCLWNEEGQLEFLGRTDDQVKLRGYRIELGEIESCASKFEGISQAVAVIRPIGNTDTLCLYYTADQDSTDVDTNELRHFLGLTLAEYMVPTAYMQLDTLPLTPNGKVDRRKLPEPTLQQETIVAPATELEQQLFDIVAGQLGSADFGVTTNLVTLGLSSIDAMRLSLAIGQQTGMRINVGELLANPTIRQMAETARSQQADTDVDLSDFHQEQDSYPLTANQRGVYIDWELNRDTTQYNVPVAICLGETDADRLADALRQVVDAHSYIKTRLESREGSVVQLRRDDAPVQVSVSAIDSEPDRDFFQQRVRPFNLFADDLYRLEVYTYGGRTWLFKDFHHIVSDGLSDAIFFRDLLAALHGTQPKKETVTAFDYALYEQQLSGTDRHAEASDYFDRLLAGAEAASYPRTASGTAHKVASITSTVADSEAIHKACRRMGITPNSYFQTVLAQVLHRLTRQEHLMLATVSSGRSLAQTEDIMGMFAKTLPLVSMDGDAAGTTFATTAQTIHRQSIESMSRDFYPLTEMVERHGLHPEILYAFEGGIYDNIAATFSPDIDVIVPALDTPKMPVEVMVYPDRQDVYTILLNFDTALYSQTSMAALASALTACATSAAKEDILLSDIKLTTDEQRAALVELGTGKHLDIDLQMTFVKAFEQCASQYPDRLAVADATDSMTYGELSRRSDILAQRLIASGVKPDDFVAVKLDRTIDFPLAVIAIHKAGAAYVPIDLEYPEDRQHYMLDDCQAKVVVDSQFMEDTDFSQNVSPIDLSSANGLAYMIYTSGSTGRPKGVMIRQRGLSSYIASMTDVLGLTALDRISLHRPFSFDAHIQDLYPVLTIGGSLHIMPSEIRRDIQGMRDFITSHGITGGSYTTSLGKLLIESGPLPLRYMTLTGERMADMVSEDVQLFNGYGPTECTDLISAYRLERGRSYANIPIGRPMANSYCFIVDAQGHLLPRGAEGELCFASVQVSTGYWQQPELTAEKFVDCPFLPLGSDGQPVRMYRTGDLCRWNDEDQLEFLGRIDSQVKLRGYRIEPGEIESCTSGFKGISQAVAVVRRIGGSDTLCLYYTTDQDTAVDTDELRQFLSQTLAEYMVPTAYMQLDALPLLPNGKVDRRHLPEPTFTSQKKYVAPGNKAEEVIARLLGDVLSWNAPISMLDNFFSLGGDSIKLIHLVSLLYNEGYTAQVSELMKCSTVRDMASMLISSDEGPAIPQEPVTGAITPSAFQQRFLSWKLAQPGRFVQAMVLRSSKSIDPVLFSQVLQALAVHHDMLRATVVGSSIVIRPTTDEHLFAFEEMTLQEEDEVAQTIAEAALREGELIDLEHGPILRAVLLHATDGDRLLLVCHHIAIDGVSWRILSDDLHTALSQQAKGQSISLPRKTHSFAYWTEAISRYRDSYLLAMEKNYWQQLQGQMESLELTAAGSRQARRLTVTLEGDSLKQLLTRSSKAYNTEINDLLLTALSQSYHRLTGNSSLTIQMEGHGREPLHEPVVTNRTVGWFTSFYPVIIQGISGDVRHDVRLVKELLRNVPNKGIGYGILQYMESHEGDPKLRTDLTPLVGFNFLGEVTSRDAEIVYTEPLDIPLPSIDINCAIIDGRFVARFEYDSARWTDDKAQQLADAFVEELSHVAKYTAQATAPEPTASDFGVTGWTDEQFQSIIGHLSGRGEQLQRVYPLSPMQEGILIKYLSDRDTTAYRLLFRLSLSVLPTEAALRQTLDYLAEKHEVLRTAILFEGIPQPCQAIVSRQLGLEMRDLTSEPNIEAAATAVHQEMLHRKLSLTDDPLFQLVCMKTGDDSCQLLFFMHHIISDGWCTPIIFSDFLMKLDAETAGRPLPATTEQNGRYEAFVRQLLRRDRKTGLVYWKNLLSDYDSRAALPSYGQPTEKDTKPIVRHTLDESLTASLRELAVKSGVTLNTVMELGWGLVLQSFCRTDDTVFLRVVSGRDSSDGDNSQIVGPFINSVPVRVHAAHDATVRQALKQLQEQSAQSAAYDFCPLSEIMSQTPLGSSLFQSVMAFENYPLGDTLSKVASHKWNIRPVQMEEEPFGELSIAISPESDGTLRLTFTYDTSLYNGRQIQQAAETFGTILRSMAAMPDGQLGKLDIVSADERFALVELGAGKQVNIDPQMTFVKAFERCASQHPDNLAVADDTESLTYGELSRRSNVLAQRLIASGVKPNDFVAVQLDRTIDFPIAVIAIQKAGAAYVPIDLEYPEDRQQYMLNDCQAKVVIDGQFIAETDFSQDAPSVDLSTTDGLAYMIYTSGSTGKPKGVMIRQRGLSSYIASMVDVHGISSEDRISVYFPFAFDGHVMDLYPALTQGGSVHIVPSVIRRDPTAIRNFIMEHGITGGCFIPSMGTLLIENDPLPLRYMDMGGERMVGLVSKDVQLINCYGPTECTNMISAYLLERGRTYSNIPIGRPLANCQCFIVDANNRMVPQGVAGELCIAGIQVGVGYWKQPELTAEKFCDCPFLPLGSDGQPVRMYHTGDLCRWNEEHQLEFLGRTDEQVKLRGYRIELGEIESCANNYKGIKQAVAAVREIAGSNALCLYYTTDDAAVDTDGLRQFLGLTLAAYMVPTAYMQLDALPTTPNGKVDRRHLPEPSFTAQTDYVAPESKAEETVARLLGNVLSWQEPVSMLDNFFSLGGDSIKLIHLVSLLSGEGYTAQVSDLMKCSTVREMAHTLVCISDGPAISQDPVTGAVTPGAIQQRFLSWQLAQPGRFTQSVVMRVSPSVDPSSVQQALQALAVHHDMLRATVVGSSIVIRPTTDEHLFALREMTLNVQTEVSETIAEATLREGELIDLEHGPTLRAVLLHADDGDRLLIVCHHIAVDGVSWRILANDLQTALSQLAQGQPISLPRKTHSFAYWTDTVSRYRDSYLLQTERPYWQQLQGQMESMELTATGSRESHRLTVTLEGEPLKQLLTTSARAYNTEINDLLLTALSQSYHRLTDNSSLTIQMEGHGREPLHEQVVTDRTVGWFTSLYPVVIQDITGDVRNDVRLVKEVLRNVPNKGIGYGILQYMESHEGDAMLRTDLTPLVGFNYLGEVTDSDAEIVFTEPLGVPLPSVDVNCAIVGGRFVARFDYDAGRWTDEQAQQLADGFVEGLSRVAAHTSQATAPEPTASDFGATGWTDDQLQAVLGHLAGRGEQLQRVYPLSPMQEGILITYLSDRDTTAYRLLFRLSLSALPTEAALRHTLDYLSEKHEVLRTSILFEDVPQPCQAIVGRQLGLEMRDLTGEQDIEAAATAVHQEMLHRRLSLTDDPLFQLVCMKTGDDSCQLLIFTHHIISDGWCTPIIFRDLLMKLDAETAGRPLPATTEQNGRYEAFVRQLLRRDRKAGLGYWKNLLADYDSRAAFPSYGQPAGKDEKPIVSLTLDESLTASLRELAVRNGVTLNTVMELGWGLVLHSFCRTDDAVFLRVVSGRDGSDRDISQLVGPFINSVPVRVHAAHDATVSLTLKELQEQSAQSAAYDFCPLSGILSQTPLGTSLFQSVMAFENYPLGDTLSTLASHKWNIRPVQMEEEPFGELSIAISPEADGTLRLTFTYDTSLYNGRQIQQAAETFGTILRSMAAMPDGQLGKLPLVTPTIQTQLTELGKGEHFDLPPNETLVSLFRQQAAATPDTIAVVYEDCQMTYRKLDELTDRLAAHLINNYHIQSEEIVGVMIERSELMVVYPLSIMKAGGAYMPLDFHFPEERLRYMCQDAGVRLILSEEDRVGQAMPSFQGEVFTSGALESLKADKCQLPQPLPEHRYVILYTSGSTGKPKGVALLHHGIVNFCHWYNKEFRMTPSDHALGYSNFGFDAHMMDLYPALTCGATVYIIGSEMRMDINALNDYMEQNGISIAFLTTQVGHLFASSIDNHSLRLLSVSGEKLMPVRKPAYEFYNCCGHTECTIYTTWYKIEEDYDSSVIGRPLDNYQLYVADAEMRLLPRGIAGELIICGEGVGQGYLHPSEKDKGKFTNFMGQWCYRTGDLVRWNSDDHLEYLGRIDTQVKLRGLRIELGEIESQAMRLEGIRQAVAIVHEGQQLCLYYTADGETDENVLRDFLAESLADYMVPTAYMQLDALPLTPNGKVDRRRLPAIEQSLLHTDYVAPRNELEKLIVSGFEKVLNQEKISVNDDFVHLGGDSLDALKVVFSLGKSGITVADILSLRTPAAIASNAKHISVNLNRYSIESGCQLNNTQMFIFQDIVNFNKYDSYLIPSLIPIDRKYTDEQIKDALDAVFTAHPVLTMHVAMRDGVPYMEKGDKPTVMKGSLNPLKLLSLLTSGFDLYSSLSRHVIIRIPGRCYLLSVIHHLIFDKISHNVFCRHFLRALEGTSLDFVDDHFLTISSFHQEVRSTEQYAEMDKYIRTMLGNLSEANFYRNPDKPGKPGYHERELGVDREQVNRFTERFGITKNILFTAAMAMTLSKLVGNDDVVFGFLDNGRDRFDNYEDIGLYINGMPLVAHVDHHDMRAYLNNLSAVYYKLSQNSYFPFGPLAQEFNIAPIILFQFFPDWITENGKNDHLPQNEMLTNKVFSTLKDFMVEALTEIMEMGNSYILRISYSGYYSRKMMKTLAKTYNETLAQMIGSK